VEINTDTRRRRHARRRARGTRAHDADDYARARGDAVASDDESDDEKKNGRDATRREGDGDDDARGARR
tara:strand:+ start:2091 stop:2297 length:207 start_codon:yes stop_codon:yes gene_type:complete